MIRYSKRVICVIALIVCMVSIKCYSEGKVTLNIGALYNGLFSNNYTNGLGTSIGFEYRPAIIKNISLSLRYKYVYSHFDDGSKIIIGGRWYYKPIQQESPIVL